MSEQNKDVEKESGPKKVAFVAMPFGLKKTESRNQNAPQEVDFDALWQQAIEPALLSLGYLAIRADNQTGSVIIKDMLEMLVHADLVIADITIPNANVYYEAGVRHAIREKGCILIRAEWGQALFDLKQITQITYPFPSTSPSISDYQGVSETLCNTVKEFAVSKSPVYELTQAENPSSMFLKEVDSSLYQFQKELSTASLRARQGENQPLRNLIASSNLECMPDYVLRDIAINIRDHLSWSELTQFIHNLPESTRIEAFFQEHLATAFAKNGQIEDAIGVLEQLVNNVGPTPIRLGTLGSRYRELAQKAKDKTKQQQYLSSAIKAYEEGVYLDLNEHYCAIKLCLSLLERNRLNDADQAYTYLKTAELSAQRSRKFETGDEWAESTLLIAAFVNMNQEEAHDLILNIIDSGWSNWKMAGLKKDLLLALPHIEKTNRTHFEELIKEMSNALPIEQEKLMEVVLPIIKSKNEQYDKFLQVHARPAKLEEIIISKTKMGEETINIAKLDDYLVKNLTDAKECYLVSKDKFLSRYEKVNDIDEQWALYDPIGSVLAIEIDSELTTELNVGEEFYIMAPWKTEQFAEEGDMFVSPLPELDEVYRIARVEFEETYKHIESYD